LIELCYIEEIDGGYKLVEWGEILKTTKRTYDSEYHRTYRAGKIPGTKPHKEKNKNFSKKQTPTSELKMPLQSIPSLQLS
jgi:hypothetical protein